MEEKMEIGSCVPKILRIKPIYRKPRADLPQ